MTNLSKLRKIKHFCHDFDGVFYAYDQVPDIHNEFATAKARVMCELLDNAITFEDAVALSHEGIAKYNDPITAQTLLASELGHDADTFRQQLFSRYHQTLLRRFRAVAPHLFTPDSRLKLAFELCQGFAKHGIATHSCRDEFCLPFLKAKEIRECIEEQSVLGLHQSGYIPKSRDPLLVQLCFESLGEVDDTERAFTEDSLINLKMLKDIRPLVTTIYIHQGRTLNHLPSYIDYQFHDLHELFQAYHQTQQERHFI